MKITFKPIGYIKTEFNEKHGIPIQPIYGTDKTGKIELLEKYQDGLKDLEEFTYVHILFFFHKHREYKLTVKPYLDSVERGLFSTRAPKRPNGIGMSIVKILNIERNIITFSGVDVINNTPLLDIKPYIKNFDIREDAKCGWQDRVESDKDTISDERF